MPITLTKALIATHERLHPRVASLLKQVERVAGRRPGMGVPEESAKLARELCREAASLLGKDGRGIGLPRTARAGTLDHGALAVALGQALAGLEAFEGEHSGWSAKAKCTVWVIDGPPMPVRRLLPPGSAANPVETHDPEASEMRQKVYKLIMGRYAAGYDAGYRDAKAGKPPSAAYAERIWDHIADKEGGDEAARLSGKRFERIYSNPPRHLAPEGAEFSDPVERAKQW